MNRLLLLPFIYLLFVTCNENEPTALEDEIINEEILVEAVVGPEGGEIRTDDLILVVPEGAFLESETLRLSITENEVPFSENVISNTFQIEGIPEDFSTDLLLKIKFDKEIQGESFIALAKEEYISERDQSEMIHDLFEADFAEGYLTCNISSDVIKTKNIDKIANPNNNFVLIAYAVYKMKTHKSITAKAIYDNQLDDTKIKLLAFYIDDVVSYFENMKILAQNYFTEANKKLKVVIFNNNTTTLEISTSYFKKLEPMRSFRAQNLVDRFNELISMQKVTMNYAFLSSLSNEEIRMLAGEIVYRFHRSVYLGVERSWFDWATIFWVSHEFLNNRESWERKFINSQLYMQPFEGMETGHSSVHEGNVAIGGISFNTPLAGHGVGMSSLVKFLMENYDDKKELLLSIFAEIINNDNHTPADFLIKKIGQTENIWLPDFFKDYLKGEIYKISSDDFLKKIPSFDEIYFTEDTDTLKRFDRTYTDLSARLCRIITSNEFKQNGSLSFKINPYGINLDYIQVLVFGAKDGKFELINEGTDFSISGLQDYSTLVSCIVNSGNEPPYTGTSNIELDVRNITPLELSHKFCEIIFAADGVYDSNPINDNVSHSAAEWGEFTENKFVASWNNDGSTSCLKYSGEITVIVNPTTLTTNYTLETKWHDKCYGNDITTKSYLEGYNVPLQITPNKTLKFEAGGSVACNYASVVSKEITYGNGDVRKLIDHTCSDNSVFFIELSK